MNIQFNRKTDNTAVLIPYYKVLIAMAEKQYNPIDLLITIEGVVYKLETALPILLLTNFPNADVAANQIIKRNSGGTAWEFAPDAT